MLTVDCKLLSFWYRPALAAVEAKHGSGYGFQC